MEVISHNGTTYTKAAVLAKEFDYTTDYLGQLCRAKKVDARLVGRAWYINKDSLIDHRKNRYTPTTDVAPATAASTGSEAKTEAVTKIAVEPVRKKRTLKALEHAKSVKNSSYISYSPDEGPLVPAMKPLSEQVAKSVPIQLAEAESVPIKKTKASSEPTRYAPEPIPKVYMAGKVIVTDLPEKSDIPVQTVPTPKKVATVRISGPKPPLRRVTPSRPTPVPVQPTKQPVITKPVGSDVVEKPSQIVKKPDGKLKPRVVGKTTSTAVPMSFAPQSVMVREQKAMKREAKTSPKGRSFVVLAVLLLAILTSATLLTAQIEFQSTKTGSDTRIVFQTSLITSLLGR